MAEPRTRVWVTHFPDRAALQLQWRDPATGRKRTRSSGTADEGEARHKAADLEYELNHGIARDPARVGWQDFRAAFEREHLSGRCLNTRLNFASALDDLERLCRPASVGAVSARTLSQLVGCYRDLPAPRKGKTRLADSTVSVRLDYLRSALAWAVRQGMLAALPAFPEVRRPEADPRPVPDELFDRLLAAAPGAAVRAYLLLGWEAGLRRTEAVRLEWGETSAAPWLDLAGGRVHFPPGQSKGRRAAWVPVSGRLEAALEVLRTNAENRQEYTQDYARVFPGWTASSANALFARLARRAGVRLSMKGLRRGFVCRFAAKVPAQVLQRLARHGNIATTMRFYASVDDAVEEAVRGNTSGNTHPQNAAK